MAAPEGPFKQVLAVIANYDYSENADLLKHEFSQCVRTLLVDASSPECPESSDIIIPNSYYPGLWNTAVSEALKSGADWLFFVASDIQFFDYDTLFSVLGDILDRDEIGIYTPSLRRDSRLAFPVCFNRATAGLRECVSTEGFCFLARTEILKELYPIPSDNTFGWGVDSMACRVAYGLGKKVVVDDRIKVFHPETPDKHTISIDTARSLGMAYLKRTAEAIYPDGDDYDAWLYAARNDANTGGGRLDGQVYRALDLGCGDNPQNPFRASEVHGVDIDPSLALKNKRVMIADLAIETIPAPDNSFDYVTAFDFIEHIPRLLYMPDRRNSFVELMNEVWRVLKPGGIFLSLTPAFPNPQAFQDPTHVNFITEETFAKYFDAQFRWASVYGFNGYFEVEEQKWEDEGKLATWMRAIRKS